MHTAGAKDHVSEVGLAMSTVTIVCQITAGAKDYISRYAAAVVHSNRKVQPLFEQSIQSDAGHSLVLLGHFTSQKKKKKARDFLVCFCINSVWLLRMKCNEMCQFYLKSSVNSCSVFPLNSGSTNFL